MQGTVTQRQDVGTYWLLTAQVGDRTVRARLSQQHAPPAVGATVWLAVRGHHSCYYRNEALVA